MLNIFAARLTLNIGLIQMTGSSGQDQHVESVCPRKGSSILLGNRGVKGVNRMSAPLDEVFLVFPLR